VHHAGPATQTLRVLSLLAARPHPVAIEAIMRAVALSRSTAYHLFTAMVRRRSLTTAT